MVVHMISPEKIRIEPVREGFTRVDGESVEDVLKILEGKGIENILCYCPSIHDFRRHAIILTQADFNRLKEENHFTFEIRGGLSTIGLYASARYRPLDYSAHHKLELVDGCAVEYTQLRSCCPEVSPEDGEFLQVNNLRLHEAWKYNKAKKPKK